MCTPAVTEYLGFVILQRKIWRLRYFRENVAVFRKLCIIAVVYPPAPPSKTYANAGG